MEGSKKNQEKMRVTIKLGGGGVGIGAVVMFGGALAAAALASAFVFKRKGLSSAKDRRGQQPEIKKQSEKEEIGTVSADDTSSLHAGKHQSGDVTESFETSDDSCLINGAQNLLQDVLPGIETGVEILNADVKNVVEGRDEISRLETLRLPETDAISDDSVVVEKGFQLDEKSAIDLDGSMKEAEVQLHEEDSSATVIDSNGNYDPELVIVDEDRCSEISEVSDEYADVIKDMQSADEGNSDAVVIKEVQVIEDNRTNSKSKVNIDKEESGDEVHIYDVEARKNEKKQATAEEGVHCNKDNIATSELEEDDQQRIQTPDNREFQVPVLEEDEEEELISPGDIQDKGCDLDDVSQLKDIERVADDSICTLENNYQLYAKKTIMEDGNSYETIGTAKDDLISEKGEYIINYDEDETDSSELHSSEHSIDSSKESNSEAVWPTEDLQELKSIEPQELKLFSDREVEGKTLEDKAVKERELHQSKAGDFETDQRRFENNLVQIETTKTRPISPTKRRMVLAILLTLSSISGSLIFGLSLTKLCFIAFLTMLFSEMNAY